MSEQQNPQDTQMAVDSSGEDAVGTTEDPADRPEPVADEHRRAYYADEAGGSAYPDEERPVPISDGDAVAGNPDSGNPTQPDLPEDVGPNAVPPRNAETNEYDKE
jgi:hypothetical protein